MRKAFVTLGYRVSATDMLFPLSICATLFRIAVTVTAQLQTLDQQANAIVDKAHEQYQHVDAALLPPPPAALTQLQFRRDSLVRAAIGTLSTQLTPTATRAIANQLFRSAKPVSASFPTNTLSSSN